LLLFVSGAFSCLFRESVLHNCSRSFCDPDVLKRQPVAARVGGPLVEAEGPRCSLFFVCRGGCVSKRATAALLVVASARRTQPGVFIGFSRVIGPPSPVACSILATQPYTEPSRSMARPRPCVVFFDTQIWSVKTFFSYASDVLNRILFLGTLLFVVLFPTFQRTIRDLGNIHSLGFHASKTILLRYIAGAPPVFYNQFVLLEGSSAPVSFFRCSGVSPPHFLATTPPSLSDPFRAILKSLTAEAAFCPMVWPRTSSRGRQIPSIRCRFFFVTRSIKHFSPPGSLVARPYANFNLTLVDMIRWSLGAYDARVCFGQRFPW